MSFMQAALKDADAAKGRFNAGLDLLRSRHRRIPTSWVRSATAGGKVVLDMARQGVPLDGVVSFHGALATETRAAPGSVKARVLVEHGAEDSMISADDVAALNVEMVKAGADYQFVSLPGPSTASPIRAPMPIRRTASTWPIRKPPTSAPGVICSGSSRTPSARRRLPWRSDRSTRRVRSPRRHACRRGSC